MQAAFGWWLAAPARFPRATYIGKTDDDSFVHIPRLLSHLGGLSCEETTGGGRAVYAGHLQFTTPNPRKAEGCTIWANNFEEAQELYVKRGCAASARGRRSRLRSEPCKWLPVSSRAGSRRMCSGARRRRRSKSDCAGGGSTQDKPACRLEDAYTGQWMSRAPLAVSYVRMSWRLVHDLRCHVKHSRLHPSNVPTNASVAIHKLKRRGALEYLWRLYGNGSWHNARAHESAALLGARVWEGAAREGRPRASGIGASVLFNSHSYNAHVSLHSAHTRMPTLRLRTSPPPDP